MMRMVRWFGPGLAAMLLLTGAGPRTFEAAVTKIDAHFEPAEAKPGQTVTFKLTVDLAPGWHTYPTKHRDPHVTSVPTTIRFPKGGDVILVREIVNPPGEHVKAIPELKIKEEVTYEGSVTWEGTAVVSPEAKPGETTVKLSRFTIQVCDDNGCLVPKTVPITASLRVLDGPAVAVDPAFQEAVARGEPVPPKTETAKTEPEESPDAVVIPASVDHAASLKEVQDQLVFSEGTSGAVPANAGLFHFILTAMFWGAVTLATPCVFPMIPITVSVFLKQKAGVSPVTQATVYALTIVVVLGVAALLLLETFRALSVNPWMNIAIGAVFVIFGLSLFGMFELTLPRWLTNVTQKGEEQGGLIGTVFMALTFSIISFSCVAPFMGGFGGMASSGNFNRLELAIGALAFSATFAAPFFFLALFPSLLKSLPKSGSWLNTVKVTMGFLELAAALKFFRTAELRFPPPLTFFTYDLTLGLYVVLSVLCGLYLLNLYRLPHDEPQETISVPRFLFGIVFITIGLHLTPALFKHGPEGERNRPSGLIYAWVDSFLLPEPSEGHGGLTWTADLRQAVEKARAEKKLVFVDFTGVTCVNCKLNERTVFGKPEFRELFEPYKRVQLYTDTVPEEFYPQSQRSRLTLAQRDADALANLAFQKAVFGTEQLPLYAILRPLPAGGDGPPKVQIVGVYAEGKINDEAAFAAFLSEPQQAKK